MQLTPVEESKIKAIFSDFHAGAVSAEDAIHDLELMINEQEN